MLTLFRVLRVEAGRDVFRPRRRSIIAAAHRGQVDKAGQPYITHPARVAARVAGDENAVAAAWLHDVVEDTGLTLADLENRSRPRSPSRPMR